MAFGDVDGAEGFELDVCLVDVGRSRWCARFLASNTSVFCCGLECLLSLELAREPFLDDEILTRSGSAATGEGGFDWCAEV